MRILAAIGGREMAVQQMVRALPDVPQTTLYRHVNYMAKQGVLKVVAEHQVRGTVERVYALSEDMARLTPADLAEATKEDHLNFFSIFATSLMADFRRYIESQPRIDVAEDSVVYTKTTVHMSDSERREFQEAFQALVIPLISRPPAEGRRGYLLGTTFFPAADEVTSGEPGPPEQDIQELANT
jgi:hypothetical protein